MIVSNSFLIALKEAPENIRIELPGLVVSMRARKRGIDHSLA